MTDTNRAVPARRRRRIQPATLLHTTALLVTTAVLTTAAVKLPTYTGD
jgi:hypothetical protein